MHLSGPWHAAWSFEKSGWHLRIIKESKTQNKKAFLLTYSLNRYLLNIYYVPDAVLGFAHTAEKEEKNKKAQGLHASDSLLGDRW